MKRLLYIVIALLSPLLMAQSTVVCTTSSPGTVIGSCASGVTSPVTTDPVSATGVWTFDNAANTPVAFSDGATVKAGTGTGTLALGGVLCKGAPAAATAGTSEEILATCTIPAATLSASGSSIRVNLMAHYAANANAKTLRVRIGGIGGTIVADSGAQINSNLDIAADLSVKRTAAATATAYAHYIRGTDSATAASVAGTYSLLRAAAITWANANDLVITGTTPTAVGDLTLDSYTVEVVQ